MSEEVKVPEPETPELDRVELDATVPDTPPWEAAAGTATEEEGGTDDAFVMSAADQKLAEANERYVRLMADFDNFRKRAAKERLDAQAYAVEEVIREIIPVVDNLERALAASQEGSSADNVAKIVKGVELTLRMFQGVLGKFGVERITAVGKPFDPNQHEALMQVESSEVEVETVAEELEPGYVMKGRVVRPARVKVLKPKAAGGGV
jgi:molecular chaperone GrpE